jgi:hypothetical protein
MNFTFVAYVARRVTRILPVHSPFGPALALFKSAPADLVMCLVYIPAARSLAPRRKPIRCGYSYGIFFDIYGGS